jgi:hypothetical protein
MITQNTDTSKSTVFFFLLLLMLHSNGSHKFHCCRMIYQVLMVVTEGYGLVGCDTMQFAIQVACFRDTCQDLFRAVHGEQNGMYIRKVGNKSVKQ